MNRRIAFMIASLIVFSVATGCHFGFTASEAPPVEWSKTCSGATAHVFEGLPYLIIQTTDGGYAVAGSTDKEQSGIWKFWLIKTDSDGIVQWNRTYEGSERNRLLSFFGTSDGGYILAGDLPDSGYSGLLVKTDSNGNMQWNRTYPQSDARFVIQTSDGGYALACIVSGAGNDGALIKTDLQGNVLWKKTYGGARNDQFESVVQTFDGGYAMAGATQSFDSSGKTKAYLVKTDSDGNAQWNKTYSRTAGHDYGRSVIQTSDGGYAIAGQTDYFGSGDAWLMKTDSVGNLTWDKTYDGHNSDFVVSIVQTTDGGYALGGQTDYWQSGDAWLIKTDSVGVEAWNETFGGSGYDRWCSVIQTLDGGYGLAGFTNSFSGDGSYDVWLVKMAGAGQNPSPRTWIVDGNGLGDFLTVQAAIDAASDGDTIFVRNGTYSESVVINKSLILKGENREKTIIDGGDGMLVLADNVKISNFTIQNVLQGLHRSVYVDGYVNMTFSDNVLLNNFQGIRLIHTSGVVIANNVISGNSAGGIGFDWVNDTIVRNNTITDSGYLGAIHSGYPNYDNTFLENNIFENTAGIQINNAFNNSRFYHNNFFKNAVQVLFEGSGYERVNRWDNGYPSGGNYWDDYIGVDGNQDGIGDTAYVIDQSNLDRYPLTNKFPQSSQSYGPVADFTSTPIILAINETATFDASVSKNGWNGAYYMPITDYEWDLGDGNDASGQTVTHSYAASGNFTVGLNVTDSQGFWNYTEKTIKVGQPLGPVAAFAVYPKVAFVGQEFQFNASLSLSGWSGDHENPIALHLWNFGDGNSTFSAEHTIVHTYAFADQYNVTLTVFDSVNMSSSCSQTIFAIMPTFVSVSTDATSALLGFVVNINGSLGDVYGNPIVGEPVVLYYTFPGFTSWFPITSGITDDHGQYHVQWIPTATGTFNFMAEWTGNITYSRASSNVTMSCISAMNQYIFSVESNSTISDLGFNTTGWELSFTASGPSGTSGYVRITIAKSLVANIANIRAYLDNNQTDFTISSIDSSWLLKFNYTHSIHRVIVDLNINVIPEFPSAIAVALSLILCLGIPLSTRRFAKKSRNESGLPPTSTI